jgi:dTDP-glucose 4,6-dehydratase
MNRTGIGMEDGDLDEQLRGSGRRAVVTGGAGFLGSWVCELLLRHGWGVVAVDSFLTGSPDNVAHLLGRAEFELVESDVSVSLEVDGPVDLVLHLASPASPLSYLRHPLETMRAGSHGTLNALQLARRHGARFLLASTSEVYGDPLEHPQRETYWGNVNPIGPRSVYDESKRFAEALTYAHRRQDLVDAAAVRIFNSYGPRMAIGDGRVVPTFIIQALRGEPLTVAGDGKQTRSLCFASDTARGLLVAATSSHGGPFNIGNPYEVTMLELAKTILETCRSSSAVEHVSLPEDDPRVRRPDLTRTTRVLGWRPTVSLTEGLARTVAWVRETAALELTDREAQPSPRT